MTKWLIYEFFFVAYGGQPQPGYNQPSPASTYGGQQWGGAPPGGQAAPAGVPAMSPQPGYAGYGQPTTPQYAAPTTPQSPQAGVPPRPYGDMYSKFSLCFILF